MADQMEDFLQHFGIKGMKWGVRRDRRAVEVTTKPGGKVRTSGGKGLDAHGDAIRARKAQQRVKGSGLNSLSDAELKKLVNRMNLEQQYSDIVSRQNAAAEKKRKAGFKMIGDTVKGVEGTAKFLLGKEQVQKIKADLVKKGLTRLIRFMSDSGVPTMSFKTDKSKPYKHTQNY